MSTKQDPKINSFKIGVALGAALGVLITAGHYNRQESTIDARWQAVTGTTIEQAEERVKACQPCYGTLATHRGKR